MPGISRAYGHSLLADFLLDPAALHLNHGSYGAVPRRVMQAQNGFRELTERRSSSFFRERYFQLLTEARGSLAGLLGGQTADWVFTENATSACNAVLLSQDFAPGDEVLITSGIYGAVRKALSHWLGARGVTLVEVPLPLPMTEPAQITKAVQTALTSRTRLAIFDHITSTSALELPVAVLAALCRANGTLVLIDGAHAPGQIALDVTALGVDYYTGNAHKWFFAPKGCAVLWAAPQHQDTLHPAIISHGLGQGMQAEFDWVGTRDSSAWFSLPEALKTHEAFGGADLMARNRDLARSAGEMLARALGTELAAPQQMQTAMTTVRLPVRSTVHPDTLQLDFACRHEIEAAFVPYNDELGIRISAQIYNEPQDYERLLVALKSHFDL